MTVNFLTFNAVDGVKGQCGEQFAGLLVGHHSTPFTPASDSTLLMRCMPFLILLFTVPSG